jgi:hypothetical protein
MRSAQPARLLGVMGVVLQPLAAVLLSAEPISAIPIHAIPAASASASKPGIPAVRWDESNPGSTFSRSDDGHLHYGLWYQDVGIILTVDSQELEKVHRRHEPFFAVLVEIHYRGQGTLEVSTENISLEFVKHFKVMQNALDADDFAGKIQTDADQLDHETAREIERHPEQKTEKESFARTFQKETAELLEFVSKNSLRPARLASANPQTQGWVFFGIDSKWVSGWKKHEAFIFRMPIDNQMFEFPFELPPKPGDVMLRKRE